MPPDPVRRPRILARWEHLAIGLWAAALVGVCVRFAVAPHGHSLYPIFAGAARNWMAGRDLYQPCAEPYRYSPLVAVLFVPLAVLPDPVAEVLWRVLNAGVYLGGLAWWCRAVLPRPLTRGQVGLMFLLVLPLSLGNLHNGQSNTLVLGLILAALAALARPDESGVPGRRPALAGVCTALACLFKVYPVAVGLLLLTVHPRRFGRWLVPALAVGLLLPFVLQQPDYVTRQYAGWLHHMEANDRSVLPVELCYRDLQLLCRVCGAPLGTRAYLEIQLLAAGAMAAVCATARCLAWPQRRLLTLLTALGCCWMTVFGPATESATYVLLAPSAGWAVLEAWLERRPLSVRGVLLAGYVLLAAAQAANWLPNGRSLQALGPQPLAALLLLGGVLAGTLRDLHRRAPDRKPHPPVADAPRSPFAYAPGSAAEIA
jgi:hypothetical protein